MEVATLTDETRRENDGCENDIYEAIDFGHCAMERIAMGHIPSSFEMFGRRITVEIDNAVYHNDDYHGLAKYKQDKIVLQPSTKQTPITKDSEMHGFFHEFAHFLLYFAGEDEFSPPLHQREYLVDRLAGLLHQAIKTMRFDEYPQQEIVRRL